MSTPSYSARRRQNFNLASDSPTLLSLRAFKTPDEQMASTLQAVQGLAQAAQPGLWQPYEAGQADVLREAKPLPELRSRFPNQIAAIDSAVAKSGLGADKLGSLPLLGRKDEMPGRY